MPGPWSAEIRAVFPQKRLDFARVQAGILQRSTRSTAAPSCGAPAIQGGLDAESHVAGTGSESEPTHHLERRGDGPERDLTSLWRTTAGAD